jgi:Acyl-CoA carboxylase epsilon subunit
VTETPVIESPVVDETVLQIVRGEPTPEELAALVAVLTAVAASGAAPAGPAPAAVSGWTDRSRYVRGALAHPPNGWRAAAFPR